MLYRRWIKAAKKSKCLGTSLYIYIWLIDNMCKLIHVHAYTFYFCGFYISSYTTLNKLLAVSFITNTHIQQIVLSQLYSPGGSTSLGGGLCCLRASSFNYYYDDVCDVLMSGDSRWYWQMASLACARNMRTVSMPSSGVVPTLGSMRHWAMTADLLLAEFHVPQSITSCCE